MKKLLALFVIMAAALSLCAVPVSANSNLIVNGDFESGDTGFTSEYTSSTNLHPPGVYAVGANPHDYHTAWASFGDHTTGTGNMMMIANGYSDGTPYEVVWSQDVTGLVCDPIYPVTTYTLYAGQTWPIGEVQVKTSATGICVRFVLTDGDAIAEGWVITAAHVAAALSHGDIPQKNGNPIPGQFPVNVPFDPGVTDTDWICFEYAEEDAVIAAHAKIELPELGHMEPTEVCLASGAGSDQVQKIDEGSPGYPNEYPGPYTVTSVPSVLTWVHPSWPSISGADWISDSWYIQEPIASNSWRLFTSSFNIPLDAVNITGTITEMTADNAEEVILNGTVIGSDGEVYGSYVDDYEWNTIKNYSMTSALTTGTNTLEIMVRNYPGSASATANPTGLIYKLCYRYEQYVVDRPYDCVTGWAADDGPYYEPFPGKNWATYIEYTKVVECDYGSYLLEFYAASSYPTNPAQLQVIINGDVLGTLDCTATPGEWVKFSDVWDADVDHALIEIRDLRNEFSGDDFVIDDISFVEQ